MNWPDKIQRTVLPIPDRPRTGLVTYDAKDPALTQRHKDIPAWDEMTPVLKPVLIRQMEVYAGFLEYADVAVARQ